MKKLTAWLLATAASMTPVLGVDVSMRIDVDCESERALERALARAKKLRDVDIYLHGVCEGNFVIAGGRVTLRGATPESGLAAPDGAPGSVPVLEVVDARVNLRDLVVQGIEVGVLARGWDAELALFEVDVHVPDGVGAVASRGAQMWLFDSTVRDGLLGVLAQTDSQINLQRMVISNHDVGVVVADESFAAISDTTIENCHQGGLNVVDRSDVNLLGGVLRENGEVHVNANDWSRVTLLDDVVVGSESDATLYALGANRNSTISSYTTAAIYGDVGALVGASIRLGNTVLHGDLSVVQFSNAHVRSSEITGIVICSDGADAICSQTTTGGALDCPSATCGSATPDAVGRAPSVSDFPVVEAPRLERLPSRADGPESDPDQEDLPGRQRRVLRSHVR